MPDRPVRFAGYTATRDTISPAAAAEMLAGLHAPPVAASGPPLERVPLDRVRLERVPFFPADLIGHPVVRSETVRAAGAAEVTWHEMFEPGSPGLSALAAAQAPRAGTAPGAGT